MRIKKVELYVKEDKKEKEFEVVVKVGRFKNKEEAAGYASYIYLTQSIDFGQREYMQEIKDLLDVADHENKTLH
tara:strand:+ start:549 stop:770 length:222 start_codon:yes stop_codon:yes gene_type:complete